MRSNIVSLQKTSIPHRLLVILVGVILLIPRLPIAQLGIGELSIRVDGVLSAFLGVLLIYMLRTKVVLISLIFLIVLYCQNFSFISVGLCLQVLSILSLPLIFIYLVNKEKSFGLFVISRAATMVIWYGMLNIIIASAFRVLGAEICADSLTNTGCIGPYGLFDRPYIFSIFIGSGFVFLCAGRGFTVIKLGILLYGLVISDSRSIAAIMFLLGFVVFLKVGKVSYRNIFLFTMLIVISMVMLLFAEGKMNPFEVQSGEIDPSWLMRQESINNYMEWVDLPKFLFGDGALAFYQFSTQYGVPGPIDNLYFRVASEIGLLGSSILLVIFFGSLLRISIRYKNVFFLFLYTLAISIISVFQESLITPRAGHVLIVLGIYLVTIRNPRNAVYWADNLMLNKK